MKEHRVEFLKNKNIFNNIELKTLFFRKYEFVIDIVNIFLCVAYFYLKVEI